MKRFIFSIILLTFFTQIQPKQIQTDLNWNKIFGYSGIAVGVSSALLSSILAYRAYSGEEEGDMTDYFSGLCYITNLSCTGFLTTYSWFVKNKPNSSILLNNILGISGTLMGLIATSYWVYKIRKKKEFENLLFLASYAWLTLVCSYLLK